MGRETAFEREAATAGRDLQQAVRALIDALPGPPTSAPELVRELGIDRNLAWKLHRLANTTDPAAATPFVPGRGAMRLCLEAARTRSVPDEVISTVEDAEESYHGMIRRHAGDRASAALMLGAAGAGEGPDLGMRRAALRAMGFLAGVRMRTHLSAFIVAPGSDPDRVDVVAVKGFYGVERIRPAAPFAMPRPRAAVGTGVYTTPMDYGAIQPPPPGCDLPLLGEFCSQPVPRFTPVKGEEGFVEDELEERPLGRQGACTIVRATRSPNLLPRYKTPGDEVAEVSTRLRTPCEVVVLDKFVHEDAYGAVSPWVRVYGDLAGEAAWLGDRRDRFAVPSGERVEDLGTGLDHLRTPDVPRYEPMMAHIFTRLGWDPGRFHVYRVRIELPLIPTTVMLVHEQADR